MIFWLLLKLEISYRVMKILVSFTGFFLKITIYFCMVKYLSLHNSSFALRYFLKWQGHSATHPCFNFLMLCHWLASQEAFSMK
jgi:hypothetical protein